MFFYEEEEEEGKEEEVVVDLFVCLFFSLGVLRRINSISVI